MIAASSEKANTAVSDASFWSKVMKNISGIGRTALEAAITLYHCMRDSDTPYWAKAEIAGALAYFISPVDAIPDVIPVVGYSDDAGVLALAVVTVIAYVKKEHEKKAKDFVKNLFGSVGIGG